MEADFSGYATKAGLKCSDGRTITPQAFTHCDKKTVPLVWQHGHSNAENVLGHAVLEARNDGVYAYGFFNDAPQGQNAKALVLHGDITSLSIYANQLVEKSKQVLHGMIREVSLVLSGANPGALIDFVNVQHSDGDIQVLDDEAVIYTGLTLEHAAKTYVTESNSSTTVKVDGVVHRSTSNNSVQTETIDDGESRTVAYTELDHASKEDATVSDIYETLNDEQKDVVHYMIGAALAASKSMSQSEESDDANGGDLKHKEGSTDMGRNVFENNDTKNTPEKHILSHEDVKGIVSDAIKLGSLRDAVDNYAVQHGINDVDLLFPEARLLTTTPEFDKRRTEWVAGVLGSTRKTPFSRVKTVVADLTLDQARAKGYIKSNMKKEEWFGLTRRTTSPTTVYKKQKLDRDDIVDIVDFDVVAWLKGEMRLMLEEEIARAILISDGRGVSDEDKIKDPIGASDGVGIRSILHDHELFVTTIEANVDDVGSSYDEVVDAILDGMEYFRGTGTPDFYTTIRTLNMFLKAKDTLGRRLYATKAEVAAALGVANIIPVEVMNDETDLIGIIVNLSDYNIGADKGGEIGMFDDFDIDYNQWKYLIETRVSGALTKIKSALVIRKTAGTNVLAVPTKPSFDKDTSTITFPTVTGVIYQVGGVTKTGTLVITSNTTVTAIPDTGYYFTINPVSWTFEYGA